MAFICQVRCVNSTDLKPVFQRSEVLLKQNLVMNIALFLSAFILFSPCIFCFSVTNTGIAYGIFLLEIWWNGTCVGTPLLYLFPAVTNKI